MKISTILTEAVDKKALLSGLKSALISGNPQGRISSGDIQEDDNDLGIRYWGNWEIPEGEEDDGDYDWEVLSDSSRKKLKQIIDTFETANKCKVNYQTSEKNWIHFSIK